MSNLCLFCETSQYLFALMCPYTVDVVAVVEGDDAVLPCSLLSTENIQSMVFSWSKDDKEVFFYDRGRLEEDREFTGRLTLFQHEFKYGNASIKIHTTRKTDGGRYSCHFPNMQKSDMHLRLAQHLCHSLHLAASNRSHHPLSPCPPLRMRNCQIPMCQHPQWSPDNSHNAVLCIRFPQNRRMRFLSHECYNKLVSLLEI
uniref:Ig-like domain-containing protein n=1 Tax=Neogobius melanostomus TaxID=47308 RepID=A0A8C6SNP0_9GOBI